MPKKLAQSFDHGFWYYVIQIVLTFICAQLKYSTISHEPGQRNSSKYPYMV